MVSQYQRSKILAPALLSPAHSPPESSPRDPTTSVDGATSPLLAAIITAYCPPVQSIETAGPLTNYFQQYHQLRQSGVTSPDPRNQFFSDLTATAHAYIQKRHELVIMLDSNDDLTDFSPTHSLTTECGLFSVHEQADYAADSPAPATYARGGKKIDHILVTAALLPAVTCSRRRSACGQGILDDGTSLCEKRGCLQRCAF
jgi:hypothetical protein